MLTLLARLGPSAGDDRGIDELMTGESSLGAPANYAGLVEEGVDSQSVATLVWVKVIIGVNVNYSDRAQNVQMQSEVESCDETERTSKEKFREFWKKNFQTVQLEDSGTQSILKILGDSSNASYADVFRNYIAEYELLLRSSEASKCGNFAGLQLVIPKLLQQPNKSSWQDG